MCDHRIRSRSAVNRLLLVLLCGILWSSFSNFDRAAIARPGAEPVGGRPTGIEEVETQFFRYISTGKHNGVPVKVSPGEPS